MHIAWFCGSLLGFCTVPTQKAPLNAFVIDVTPHKDLLW